MFMELPEYMEYLKKFYKEQSWKTHTSGFQDLQSTKIRQCIDERTQ